MNNLEQMKKRRNKISAIIAILIVLNLLLLLVFATTSGDENSISTFNSETGDNDPVVEEELPPITGDKDIADVVTGADFTVALDSEGYVWAWGQNGKGQLGNGDISSAIEKKPVLSMDTNSKGEHIQLQGIKQIAAGEYHAAALTTDGEVYIWGYNYFGQTGSENAKKILYASKIYTNGKTIKEIACGADYTLALATDGEVLGLGDSTRGQLGYYNDLAFTSIRAIEEFKETKELPSLTTISAGYNNVVGLDSTGRVWTWGDNSGSGFEFTTINEVTGFSGAVTQVKAGNGTSIALDENGNVYTWNLGNNVVSTQIDLSTLQYQNESGETVQLKVRDVAVLNSTYYVIDEKGTAYAWGTNNVGQTGTGNTSACSQPTKITFANENINKQIDKITSSAIPGTSGDTGYAINADGYVLGWGYAGTDITNVNYTEGSNNGKLLGDGTRYNADYIGSISVKSIVGNDITLKVGDSKNLIKMLLDGGYIIGGRVNLYREETTSLQDSIEIKSVDESIASYNSEDGNVTGITLGKTAAEVKSPKNTIYINITVLDDNYVAFPKIENRNNFAVALKADGTVWAWGYNSNLGIIDTAHSNGCVVVPTQVQGLENVKDIAVGENFALVLKNDGTVLGWGYNTYSQLGDGTNTTQSNGSIRTTTPNFVTVKIDNENALTNIEAISAGTNHAMALDKDGNVWAWGYNSHGQIGIGSNGSSVISFATKVNLANLVDKDGNKEEIKQIEAGVYNSYILTQSGNVYACGYSGNYQCGNGTSYVYVPTKISALNKITKISAGMYSNGYAVATAVNGSVWTWGYNSGYPMIINDLSGVIDVEAVDNSSTVMYKLSDATVGYRPNIYTNASKYTFTAGTENFKGAVSMAGANGAYIVTKSDGTVWASGTNGNGQLGDRTVNSVSATTLEDISKAYTALDKHEVTIKEGATVNINATYSYGFNLINNNKEDVTNKLTYTSLNEEIATVSGNTITGVKSGKTYVEAETETGEKLRVTVNVLSAEEVVTPKVSVGYNHTVSLKADGTVWGFGNSNYGQLATTGNVTRPQKLAISGEYKDIAAGANHTLLLGTDGKVYSMGYNYYGQLGNNTKSDSTAPVTVQKQITDADGNITYVDLDGIVRVETYIDTSFALDENGVMYVWGQNAGTYATPIDLYGFKVKDISTKLILTEDGRVWEYETPTSLKFVRELNNIVEISSSSYSNSTSYGYFMALDAKGNIYTWVKSANTYNRVTSSESTTPSVPTFTSETLGFKPVSIEAGVRVAYAIDENGNTYAWGINAGTGTLGGVSASATPQKISTLANVESIAASKYSNGNRRAYAVLTNGSVYGFGANGGNYLLGLGTTSSYYNVPTLIGDTYAGVLVNGKEQTRLYMNQGESLDIKASLLDSFNLRLESPVTSEESDFNWTIFNNDLVGLTKITTKANEVIKVTANSIIGEATLVATDSVSGKTARVYIDVKLSGTEVAPKIESSDTHTVALKADGTVWVWGTSTYGVLPGVNTSEPKQVRIAQKAVAQEPTITDQVTEDGKQIYVDTEGNNYYKVGNDYCDLASGDLAIKLDTTNNTYYKWDNEENNYALEDLKNADGSPIIVTDIATANNHTLLLTKDGDVYSFGDNYYGQLGYSTPTRYQYLPQKVSGLKDIVKIAAGNAGSYCYSIALDKEGNIYTAGHVAYTAPSSRSYYWRYPINNQGYFAKVNAIDGVNIEEIAKNTIDITNQYALTKDGEVYALLKANNNGITTGTKIEGIDGKVIKVTRTSGSNINNGHTAFLTENGTLYTIGAGTSGQLGNETWKNSSEATGNIYTAVNVLNEDNETLTNIRDVYVGATHTIAMAKDGSVYTWGSNSYGELRSSKVQSGVRLARAYKVEDDAKIKEAILVSAGNGYSIVVDNTGFAYAWGLGTSAQLGNGLNVSSLEAKRVGIEGIRLNKNHVTLKENGASVDVTGYNTQLNLIYNPTIDIQDRPMSTDTSVITVNKTEADKITINPVKAGTTSAVVTTIGDNGEEFISIVQVTVLPEIAQMANDVKLPADRIISPMTVSGDSHTLILKSDGTVFAYGNNSYGQTAADAKYSDKVTEVKFADGTPAIAQVAAGDNFSMALDIYGNVYTWGYNGRGQLGLGSADGSTHNVPTKVNGISNIVKIVAGANHCVALSKDGYVYTWGQDTNGSLGQGSQSYVTVPTKVNYIASVIDIAAGENHTIALTSNGNVYTTGNNSYGQLGERYITRRLNFTKVEGITRPIEYIEAGNKTSVAIDVEGILWVWGNNEDGQLGLGIDDQIVYAPTKATVGSGATVQSASAGANHIQVVTSDGRLYIAGSNNHGQLGIGEGLENSNTFRQVTSLGNNVMNSDAGSTYSTAITKDGMVYGFGDYNHGNAERISLTNSYKPVMISNITSYLDEQEVIIKLGETYKVNANGRYKLNVLYKDDSKFTYTSANDQIASVDVDGVITGNDIGTTMITAADETGKLSSVIVKIVPTDAIQSPVVEGGDKFAVVTDKFGTVYVFGNKENVSKYDVPKTINDSVSLKTVKAGKDFAVAINHDGTVWAWGDNSKGQLGIEGIENSNQIVRLNTGIIKGISQVDAGDSHVIALDELGTIYVWGDNSNGQLGINKATSKVTLPTVIRPVASRIISVSAGGNYSSIVDAAGKVYILANGKVQEVSGISGAVKVVTGKETTMVLTSDGTVHMVNNATHMKTQTITNKSIVDIATNGDAFMLLTKDKELYTFGNNANGQLGNKNASLDLVVADKVFTIGGGYTNTYYINVDGEVFAAGLNTSGELGNGTMNTSAPTSESSSTYTKVGDREYKIKEAKKDGTEKEVKSTRVGIDWTVLVGKEDLKASIGQKDTRVMLVREDGQFNAFGLSIENPNDYEFKLTDTTKAKLDKDTNGNAEITTLKDLGETTLQVTNKATGEVRELRIFILDAKALRIEDIYALDTEDKKYYSEPDVTEADFIINTEGSTDNGSLNILLEFETDTLTAFDSAGNALTVSQNAETGEFVIEGLDLTLPEQKITLKLTIPSNADGVADEVIEYTVILRKDVTLKVDEETLAPQEDGSYVKFINPANTQAKVEITILTDTRKIQLEDLEGNIIATSADGSMVLTTDVNVPNHDNEFVIKILDGDKVERKSKLTIYKSSIESISVKDIENPIGNVKADREEDTEVGFVDKFYVEVDEVNSPATVTINLRNKNVQVVKVDGETKEVSENIVFTTDKANENIIIELEVLDPVTGTTYTEKYKLEIHKILSNNKIKEIKLTSVNGQKVGTEYNLADPMFKASLDEDYTYEIVLHDKNVDITEYFKFIPTLEDDSNAEVSINNRNWHSSGWEFDGVPNKENRTENKGEYTLYVKAENGDVQKYKVVIYKESEDAKLDTVIAKSPVDGGNYVENKATNKPETPNDYIVKVVKDKDSYEIVIKLRDEYAKIEAIEPDGLLTLKSSSNGEYVYTATPDIIGQTITIKTKPEYANADGEEYRLTVQTLDSNEKIGSIKLGDDLLAIGEDEKISVQIKAADSDLLTVTAESEYATVEVYNADPRTNADAKPVATGKGSVEGYSLGIDKGQTGTVYIKVTSEDGQNVEYRALEVKRLSDSADLISVIFDNNITKAYTAGQVIEIKQSEITDSTNIKVTISDNATATIEGIDNATGYDTALSKDKINTINVTVTSEDKTVVKTYEVQVKVLSANTEITKQIQTTTGSVLKDNDEFTSTGTDAYSVKVRNTGTVDLVVKPNPETDKVTIKLGAAKVNGTAVADVAYQDGKLTLDTNNTTEVDVIVTAEDGTQKHYTIVVAPEVPVLTQAIVQGYNASNQLKNTRTLTNEEINKNEATVRVHPNSTKVLVNLTANTIYTPVSVKAYTNKGQIDEDGNSIEKVVSSTLNAQNSFYVDLVGDKTQIVVEMTTNAGQIEILTLTVEKGSTEAKLEAVTLKGANTQEENKYDYDETNTLISTAIQDSLYNVIPVPANNGTYELYEVAEDGTENLVATDAKVALDYTPKKFKVKVTAEFDGATKDYEVFLKKISNDATIKDLTVEATHPTISAVGHHLADFGAFDENNSINILVPDNVLAIVTLKDLVLSDDYAKAKWTNITDKDKDSLTDADYTDYTGTETITLSGIQEGKVYIKVTAENRDEKVYTLNIVKASDDVSLTNTTLFDITNNKEVINGNDAIIDAQITEETEEAKVTSTSKGVISIKVTKVNGKEINENISTTTAKIGSNELALDFMTQNYTYTDAEGNTKTILAEEVNRVEVVTNVESQGHYLYPEYYDDNKADYTLVIQRKIADTNIIVELANADGSTSTIDTKDLELEAVKEGEDIVYTYEYKVPSAQTELVINNVRTHNTDAQLEHVLIKEASKVGNNLYTAAEPYTKAFDTVDKASITENFVVTNALGNKVTYRLKVTKKSANNDIGALTLNGTEITRTDDVFNAVILGTPNKLKVGIADVEENATVTIKITGVNGTSVSIDEALVIKVNPTDGKIEEQIEAQLANALEKLGIDNSAVSSIAVSISVQAEDTAIAPREYTLNINAEESNLISINGLDNTGTVAETAQLTVNDFTTYDATQRAFVTEVIAVPSNTDEIELSKILCENDTVATVKVNGADVTDTRKATITVEKTGETQVRIDTTVEQIEQSFIIKIRRRSTDTDVTMVKANNIDALWDEGLGAYVVTIRDTVDAKIDVKLNDINAKIVNAEPVLSSVTVSAPEKGEKVFNFDVSGIKEITHNKVADTDETGKTVDVIITVEAEDGNTKDYTIRLERKHTENKLSEVKYIGDNGNEVTAMLGQEEINVISSTTTGITLKSIEKECANSKVYVEYTDDTTKEVIKEEFVADKFYDIKAGTTKQFKLIVVSEYGIATKAEAANSTTYILNVRRKSADTGLQGPEGSQGIQVSAKDSGTGYAKLESGVYTKQINVNEDPTITVIPKDSNAKVVGVKINGDLVGVKASEIKNNSFSIIGLKDLYIDDATEDASSDQYRFITLEITVAAEDKSVTQKYTLKLERRHIETGLDTIAYDYTDIVEVEGVGTSTPVNGNVTFDKDNKATIKVKSVVESVNFAQIVPSCDEAKEVEIKVGTEKITQTTDGFSVNLPETVAGDGCIKVVTIKVIAESGATETYTITVKRMATNASLNIVKVNDVEATRTELTEEEKTTLGIEAIYRANVKDSDLSANIYAESANEDAIVSIDSETNDTFTQTIEYTKLSSATDREVEVLIVVTPEDVTKPSKTYKLILTRLYDSVILESISVKPEVDGVEGEIVLKDNKDHDLDFAKKANGSDIYYLTDRNIVDTAWTHISIGNLLPNTELADGTKAIAIEKIERISSSDPYSASTLGEYTNSVFEMPEGVDVYFKVITKAESGNTGVYVINVYKKATSTNLTNITVAEKSVTPEIEVGVEVNPYKVNVDANKLTLPIQITGENNLSSAKTTVRLTNEDGVDITDKLGVTKTGSGKVITLTLNNLDYLTNKVITATISVVPEDETIAAKEYTVEITRQHTSVAIKEIVVNKDRIETTVDGVDKNIEQRFTSTGFTVNKYGNYVMTQYVTSQGENIKVDEINLECQYATITIDGKPLEEALPLEFSLAEKASKTVKVVITPESEDLDAFTGYITFVRMSADDSIGTMLVQREYIAKDSDGTPLKDNPRYENYPVTNDENNYSSNIHMDADTTKLTLVATDKDAIIDVEIVSTQDRDDNTISNPSMSLGYTTYKDIYGRIQNNTNSRVVTLDTTATGLRKIVLKVTVKSQETIEELRDDKEYVANEVPLVEPEVYTITLIKQDNSAEIDVVNEILGEDRSEIPVDTQKPHYNYAGKDILDKEIYVKYIGDGITEVNTEVVAKSKFANVYMYAEDGTELSSGIGTGVTSYAVQTPGLFTKVKVLIVAEDGIERKEYEIWYIRKSDDDSISELYVDDEEVPVAEDGNYYITIPDSIKQITARLIPNYELANVSINGQLYKWKETTETINLNDEKLIEGKIRIELKVQIPAEQSVLGENKVNTKYLYVTRVSTDNGIEEITTDNSNDNITPGNRPQSSEYGTENTYNVILDGARDTIDLRIVPVSPGATVQLFDITDNELSAPTVGTLIVPGLGIDAQQVTTYKVKVTPEQGEAKEYYIKVTPKESQAELKEFKINGVDYPTEEHGGLQEGIYEYTISNYGLTGIGEVYALAKANSLSEEDSKYGSATVNIYTKDNPSGSGKQTTGVAELPGVDLDNTTYITVTVVSPNGANTNTYVFWLKEVSDDRTLEEVSYIDINGEKQVVDMIKSTEVGYEGEYEIVLEPEQNSVDVSMITSSEISTITVEDMQAQHTLSIPKDLTSMTEDIVLDIVVTAESGNSSKYKLTIKKNTIITGKVTTENYEDNFEGIEVKFTDITSGATIATAITQANGAYSVEVPTGEYDMVIAKKGYLTYTVRNVPATYGVRTYTGNRYLVAGEVYADDEFIDARDLVRVNKLIKANAPVDDTNKECDFNEDGQFTKADLNILRNNYNRRAVDVSYKRFVELSGVVLDASNGDKVITDATIEMRNKKQLDENGEFIFENMPLNTYVITVKDSEGKILGQEELVIEEGAAYEITNNKPGNVITIDPNTYLLNIAVRVNGERAIVSKRDEQPNEDLTAPSVNKLEGKVTTNGIELTADVTDANGLSKVEFYVEGQDEPVYVENVQNNAVNAKVETTINSISTEFNKTHKFNLVVTDASGNTSRKEIEVTDNVIRSDADLVTFSNIVNKTKDEAGNIISTKENNTFKDETVILAADATVTQPIGVMGKKVFKGTFDGNGHTITLAINSDSDYNVGLFGYTEDATIKNLGVKGNIIAPNTDYVGAIVGDAMKTTIENCYSEVSIEARDNIGGIVGYAENDTIIRNCYNSGSINANETIGGIVGRIAYTSVTIENCYNIGTIEGINNIGEIVGYLAATEDNKGDLSIPTITNCYCKEADKGIGTSNEQLSSRIDEILSKCDVQAIDMSTLLSSLGAEFKADFATPINSGYPILKWQKEPVATFSMKSAVAKSELILPVDASYTITSEFGSRIDPVSGEEGDFHSGLDIAAPWQTPVLAVADGTVTYAGENGGYGYCIEIEHIINGEKIYSVYAHLSRIDVAVGDTVLQGDQIALEGGIPGDVGSGTSTGAHLHFEIRKISGSYSSAVDPRNYLEF